MGCFRLLLGLREDEAVETLDITDEFDIARGALAARGWTLAAELDAPQDAPDFPGWVWSLEPSRRVLPTRQ